MGEWYARGIAADKAVYLDHGVAYVLPLFEAEPRLVKRLGRFAVGASFRLSSLSIGFELLKAGLLVEIGPFYLWVAHIEKQFAAYEAELQS